MPLFTPLHRLLGRDPGPLTDEFIEAAVAAGLRETDDLDWKDRLPPQKGLSDTDFPKDVAAMANYGGGVLVYGVDETERAATARTDAGELDERYERALRAAAVSAIRPPVLGLGVFPVGDPGKRAVVVVVPASMEGPHLIWRNQMFGAPIRNDADTAWMTERQLEAAYRARFDERRRATEVLDGLYAEADTNWATGTRAWLVAVAHPRFSITVPTRPTREEAAAMVAAAVPNALLWAGRGGIHPLENVDRYNLRPGLRRWVAPNERNDQRTEWRAAWAALHHDGSISLAAAVGGHRDGQDSVAPLNTIDGSAVECAVSDFMALIRAASGHFGTTDYDVRVGVEPASDLVAHDSIVIRGADSHGFPYDGNSFELLSYTPVEITVTANAGALDYYWQVHDLAQDCINQGGLTHVRLINPPERDG
jgi:hypothetical protein